MGSGCRARARRRLPRARALRWNGRAAGCDRWRWTCAASARCPRRSRALSPRRGTARAGRRREGFAAHVDSWAPPPAAAHDGEPSGSEPTPRTRSMSWGCASPGTTSGARPRLARHYVTRSSTRSRGPSGNAFERQQQARKSCRRRWAPSCRTSSGRWRPTPSCACSPEASTPWPLRHSFSTRLDVDALEVQLGDVSGLFAARALHRTGGVLASGARCSTAPAASAMSSSIEIELEPVAGDSARGKAESWASATSSS